MLVILNGDIDGLAPDIAPTPGRPDMFWLKNADNPVCGAVAVVFELDAEPNAAIWASAHVVHANSSAAAAMQIGVRTIRSPCEMDLAG